MKIALWGLVKAGTAAYRAWTANKVGRRLFPRWFERREERRRARRQEAEAAGVEGEYQYEEDSMNMDSVLGIVRHVLTTLGGGLVTAGVVSAEELQTLAGAAAILVGVAWSLWHKRQAKS